MKIGIFFMFILIIYFTSISYAESYDEVFKRIQEFGQTAKQLEDSGQFLEAIKYYNQSIDLLKSFNDKYNIAISLTKIGVIYGKIGEYDTALRYFQESNKLFEGFPIDSNVEASIGNMGIIYAYKGDLDKAIEIFTIAYNISKNLNDTHGQSLALTNIGSYYEEKNNFTTAIEFYNSANELLQGADNTRYGLNLLIIGNTYTKLDDFNSAEYYYLQAVDIFTKLNDTENEIYSRFLLGEIYRKRGNYYEQSEDYNNALEFYNKSINEQNVNYFPSRISQAISTMHKGDSLLSLKQLEDAINEYKNAREIIGDIDYSAYFETDAQEAVKTLVDTKLFFVKGLQKEDMLDFEEAAKFFNMSSIEYKNLLNFTSMRGKESLIFGFYYYSSSKKNQNLFRITSNEGYLKQTEIDLSEAKRNFIDAGWGNFARDVIKDKIIIFPVEKLPLDEYLVLFYGLYIQELEYPRELVISNIGYIKFNYKYLLDIPVNIPRISFCCQKEFCSDWIRISDNQLREVKIQVQGVEEKKIVCDIKIYGETNPDIPISDIKNFYHSGFTLKPEVSWNEITLRIIETNPYETIEINIHKPLLDVIFEWLQRIEIILSILGISLLYILLKIYHHLKKKNNRPRNESANTISS